MLDLNLNKTIYNKQNLPKNFNEFGPIPTSPLPSQEEKIEEFFSLYKELFFEIPKQGDINSHEFLINESTQYIGTETLNDEISALLEEITELRQENLTLNQQLTQQNSRIK